MPDLDAIAARHGVGQDAVRHLLGTAPSGRGRGRARRGGGGRRLGRRRGGRRSRRGRDAIAARHGVGQDAVRHLLDALARGHGRMAQFDHPDLGGSGPLAHAAEVGMVELRHPAVAAGERVEEVADGVLALKARVVALCDELAPLAAAMPGENRGSSQSQGLGSGGSWSHRHAAGGPLAHAAEVGMVELRHPAVAAGERVEEGLG
jgi:hypothetical protein